MADLETPNFDFTLIEVNASSGTWGGKTNANWSTLDTRLQEVKVTAEAALPRSGGTMTGAIAAAAGSAPAPSVTFAGDTNSGLYSPADNQVGVAVNGAALGTFRNTGWNGNVVGSQSGGSINATTGAFSGALSAASGAFSGAVSGTTGTFSGAVSGAGASFSGLANLNGGGRNFPRTAAEPADVGFLGRPTVLIEHETNHGLTRSDMGKLLTFFGGTAVVTIPSYLGDPLPDGFWCRLVAMYNGEVGSNLTIASASGAALFWSGAAFPGPRTMDPILAGPNVGVCMATLEKVADGIWVISGEGIT